MTIQDKALLARNQLQENREKNVIDRSKLQQRRGTGLVRVTGYDADKGRFIGERPDKSISFFTIESTATPAKNQSIEIATPLSTPYSKGDLKPLL